MTVGANHHGLSPAGSCAEGDGLATFGPHVNLVFTSGDEVTWLFQALERSPTSATYPGVSEPASVPERRQRSCPDSCQPVVRILFLHTEAGGPWERSGCPPRLPSNEGLKGGTALTATARH